MESETPLASPPVAEVVIGAQFSPLTKLTAAHFGALWAGLGAAEWRDPADLAPLDDQFETFGTPLWRRDPPPFALQFGPAPPLGRVTLLRGDGLRRVQMQSTRFLLNWRRGGDDYPGHARLFREFTGLFDRFRDGVRVAGLGEVAVNQWELVYVNAYPRSAGWASPGQWGGVLPGMLATPAEVGGLELENRAADWTYEIAPRQGRLYLSARSGAVAGDPEPVLLFELVARGPVGEKVGAANLAEGFEIGHGAIRKAFEAVGGKSYKGQS